MPNWAPGAHADGPTGVFGGAPNGVTERYTGYVKMLNWLCGTHADGPTVGFGGASHGATNRCTGW
eukprot:8482257-Pyramimonas_sp.AAC.1